LKLPELLAPVGSFEYLKIAIFAGASSVYLSGKKFGARQLSEDLSFNEIKEGVKLCHLYNVKVYVTVNTLIKEEELIELTEYLLDLYKIGVDGVLVQDIGVIKIIKDLIPNLNIHGSTQLNIHNLSGLKWAKEQGIKRVVLSRELYVDDVKKMTEFAHSQDMEVEIFLHGALCYSYSGRCLFSSFIGGRSGNRGMCAQPCRQKYKIAIGCEDKTINNHNYDNNSYNSYNNSYNNEDNNNYKHNNKNNFDNNYKESNVHDSNVKILNSSINRFNGFKENEKYVLSTKDLSLYSSLDQLIALGVDSLKIEGRMRNKEYLVNVVYSYRKALNKSKNRNKSRNKNHLKRKNISNSSKNYKIKHDEKDLENIENLKLVFNRGFSKGHFLEKNQEKLMNRFKPGHVGLFIGTLKELKDNTIVIDINSNNITIPEKGDGILIQDEKTNNSYGLEISTKPILENDNILNPILNIKKVYKNKKIKEPLNIGSKVYITKRRDNKEFIKKLYINDSLQKTKKSKIIMDFKVDSNNVPILKGNIKFPNNKKINFKHKNETPWEIAKNKPVTIDVLKKQLSKIGDFPIIIEDINFKYNENLFAPLKEINKLRRDFFLKAETLITDYHTPSKEDFTLAKNRFRKFKNNYLNLNKKSNEDLVKENKLNSEFSLSVYINDLESLKSLKDLSIYDKVYLEVPPKNDSYYSYNMNNRNKNKNNKSENKSKNNKNKNKNNDSYNNDKNIDKNLNHTIDVSYIVNFIKNAVAISKGQNYQLIWKFPDIAHENIKNSFIKAYGILNKLGITLNVMTGLLGLDSYLNKFNIKIYGSYPLNIFNNEARLNLNNFTQLTLSPELSEEDLINFMRIYSNQSVNSKLNNPNIEILVQGNVELLISKINTIPDNFKRVFNSNNSFNNINNNKNNSNINKNNYNSNNDKINKNKNNIDNINNNFYLNDLNNNFYPIKNDIEGRSNIVLNYNEFSLFNHLPLLKSIPVKNFVVDARWKHKNYIQKIGKYYKIAIEKNLSQKEVDTLFNKMNKELSFETTDFNFSKSLK
jgi:putative protease